MTPRQLLQRQFWRWAALGFVSAMLLFVGLRFSVIALEPHLSRGILGFCFVLAATLLLTFFLFFVGRMVRCPSCSRSMRTLANYTSLFIKSRRINYCPYCGLALDGVAQQGAPGDVTKLAEKQQRKFGAAPELRR